MSKRKAAAGGAIPGSGRISLSDGARDVRSTAGRERYRKVDSPATPFRVYVDRWLIAHSRPPFDPYPLTPRPRGSFTEMAVRS